MIHVEKKIPAPIALTNDKANKLLEDIINNKEFFTGKKKTKYSRIYRNEKVKDALIDSYSRKCAYCETIYNSAQSNLLIFNIEHYRPKGKIKNEISKRDDIEGYYWLCYSWDNLLFTCEICNSSKANFFKIQDEKNRKQFNPSDLNKIHNLSKEYNEIENPFFIHPEIDNVTIGNEKSSVNELKVYFKEFEIVSNNERIKETIEKCKLNRADQTFKHGGGKEITHNLIEERKDLLKKVNDNIAVFKENPNLKTEDEKFKAIEDYLVNIKKDKTMPHFLFRQYIVKNLTQFIDIFKKGSSFP